MAPWNRNLAISLGQRGESERALSLLREHAPTEPDAAALLGSILYAGQQLPADFNAAVAQFCSAARGYLERAQARGTLRNDDFRYFRTALAGIGQALVHQLAPERRSARRVP